MPAWTDVVAGISAGAPELDVTQARPLKLTIADLELLDRSWDPDPIHSSELIDGRIYFTPARYAPRARAASGTRLPAARRPGSIGSANYGALRGSIAMPPYDLPLPDIVLTASREGTASSLWLRYRW